LRHRSKRSGGAGDGSDNPPHALGGTLSPAIRKSLDDEKGHERDFFVGLERKPPATVAA
jgi:hypothetical protein